MAEVSSDAFFNYDIMVYFSLRQFTLLMAENVHETSSQRQIGSNFIKNVHETVPQRQNGSYSMKNVHETLPLRQIRRNLVKNVYENSDPTWFIEIIYLEFKQNPFQITVSYV